MQTNSKTHDNRQDKFSIAYAKEYTKEHKLPFIVHWNLTESCNLRCTHCCVPKKPVFVSLEDARKTIKFLKEKGFFLVTLSGGECTTHPDFPRIYEALIDNGFYVSIFTNGTHFTPEIKEVLRHYPPRKVEVSCYGVDAPDFKNTTGSDTGYDEFLDTLQFLKDSRIRTVVKAPITVKNASHIQNFIRLADRFDAEYKFGTFVFPGLDGNKDVLSDRLQVEPTVDIEFSDEGHMMGFVDRANSMGTDKNPIDIKCAAMSNSFTLNPDNSFSFCGIMSYPRFRFGFQHGDIPIQKAFEAVIAYRETVREMYEESPCGNCSMANVCPGCPAHLLLENGDYRSCDEYFRDGTLCKLEYCAKKGLIENHESFSFSLHA